MLALLLAATTAAAAGPPPDRVDIEVRVYAPPTMSQDSRAQMKAGAERILAAAGLVARWRECWSSITEPSCAPPPGPNVVIVRFVDALGRGSCGEAVTNRSSGGVVSIDSPCVSAAGRAIRSVPDVPVLTRVRDGDILGVVLAHEIGHVFGQTHTNAGIMRQSYTRAEWEQFATGHLAFSKSQALALRSAAAPILALNGKPQ